jgi:sec-independent protein translocase protein TatC
MAAEAEADPVEAHRMSLGDHLDELRKRLFAGVGAVAIFFALAFAFAEHPQGTVAIVLAPMERAVDWLNTDYARLYEEALVADPAKKRLEWFESDDPTSPEYTRLREPIARRGQTTGVGELFMVKLRAATYLGLFLGGPVLIWQLWLFIAAGLYKNERRAVMGYLPPALMLFAGGISFGYFLLVPYGFYFLNVPSSVDMPMPDFKLDQYFEFLSALCLALGFVFQLPVVMMAVARVGVVSVAQMRRFRRYFIVLAFVVAGILTPPDPYTQSMMAIPLCLLYEVGILAARFVSKPKSGLVPVEVPSEQAAES